MKISEREKSHLIFDPVDVDIVALLDGRAAEEVQGVPGCEAVAVVEGLEGGSVSLSCDQGGGHS